MNDWSIGQAGVGDSSPAAREGGRHWCREGYGGPCGEYGGGAYVGTADVCRNAFGRGCRDEESEVQPAGGMIGGDGPEG
jgi:hypothetical protein